MHRLAESGVASHWMYKDDTDKLSELQKQTHKWLQSLLEIQNQSGDAQEFLEHVKVDLFPDEVYVFTPRARSCRCRAAPPRWTSLTPCTPTSAIAASRRRSTASWSRCAPSSGTATASRSSPPATPSPIPAGCSTCAPARRAPTSATSSRPCSTRNPPISASTCSSRR